MLAQVRYLSICGSILQGYHFSSLLSYASNSIDFDIVSTEHANPLMPFLIYLWITMYIDVRLFCLQVHICMSSGESFPNLHGQLDVTGLAFQIFDAPAWFSVCPGFTCSGSFSPLEGFFLHCIRTFFIWFLFFM